jgi:hypothetical protein
MCKTPRAEDMTTISAGYGELSFIATQEGHSIVTSLDMRFSGHFSFLVYFEDFPDTPCNGRRP